ncbi:hypothetical protein OG426_30860 [Streptomyces canus]|uniref:hypothetical protein n=1 Tax=Streptomyces canus TaxID=58343 RepID=UPI0022511E97|nr:hypothetical protein [Streptomyces canus]MCX4858152.1 hypothetical protein [Streptomyces canus]WSW36532.1 hypothetical protein OG426_30860 [Streptomyces canus]
MRQLARVSALVTLYSLALRGSLRVLGWTAEESLVELALAIFFLAPIANAPLGLFYLLGTATKPVATGLTLRIRRMYLTALEDRPRAWR